VTDRTDRQNDRRTRMTAYDPEIHWTRVAHEVERRPPGNMLAGNSDPFHAYQRKKMLRRFLDTVDVTGRTVLEVGCGPGGNLLHIQRRNPSRTIGVDISSRMLDIARRRLRGYDIELLKTDGRRIDLPDRTADVTFTVTVLMHITDDDMFRRLVAELCRLTAHTLIIIERTTRNQPPTMAADRHSTCRRIADYADAVRANGLVVRNTEELRLRVSRFGCDCAHRFFGRANRKDGEPETALAQALEWSWLLVSRWVDDFVTDDLTLTKQTFTRV
jgi:SAM-dependent methyltransferase